MFKKLISKVKEYLLITFPYFLTVPPPDRGEFNDAALRTLMSRLYQNPAVQKYLDLREEQLIHEGMELVIKGMLKRADTLAGQVYEIRRLRTVTRECYTRGTKGSQEKIKKILDDRRRGQTHKSVTS